MSSMPDRNSDRFGSVSGVFCCGKEVHLTLEGRRGDHRKVSAKSMHFNKLSPSQLNVTTMLLQGEDQCQVVEAYKTVSFVVGSMR